MLEGGTTKGESPFTGAVLRKNADPQAKPVDKDRKMAKKVALQSARAWLHNSQPGYCRRTERDGAQPASCVGRSGSFPLNSSSTSSWVQAASVCLSYCRSCPRCASISVSPKHDECSWFSSAVDCSALKLDVKGFLSGPLVARNSSEQQLDDSCRRCCAPEGYRRWCGAWVHTHLWLANRRLRSSAPNRCAASQQPVPH